MEGLDLSVCAESEDSQIFSRDSELHYFTCTFPPRMVPIKNGFSVMP
jgi:hypothetical protein